MAISDKQMLLESPRYLTLYPSNFIDILPAFAVLFAFFRRHL